jgi:hypothetical protein
MKYFLYVFKKLKKLKYLRHQIKSYIDNWRYIFKQSDNLLYEISYEIRRLFKYCILYNFLDFLFDPYDCLDHIQITALLSDCWRI